MTDELDVRGGFAGTAARLADLEVSVGALRNAADRLAVCGRRVRSSYYAVSALSAADPAAAAVRARACEELLDAAFAAARQSAHADSVADRLERTAAGYSEAERRTNIVLAGLGSVWRSIRSTVVAHVDALKPDGEGLGWEDLVWTGGVAPRFSPTRDFADQALGMLGPVYELVALLFSAQANALAFVYGHPGPLKLTAERRSTVAASTGVEDAIDKVGALSPDGGGVAGRITIERLDHPDGTTGWTVSIPGTQDWLDFGGTNVHDFTANLELAAKQIADPMVAVAAAMTAEGIPPGDPVMVVAHSQGAMAALALANDDEFRGRFNVTAIATAGGPGGRYATPEGVAVLHLEHTEDLVPGLDGRANPDDPSRVTVSRSLASSSLEADRVAARSNFGPHLCDPYARTGALVDASADPSIVKWRADAHVFFGDSGDLATRATYSVERGVDSVTAAVQSATAR